MYCTGGIRCEKASAYFKHQGFKNVYQLEGGIIEYTRQIKEENIESKFIGKNFVFDHRLGERITDDIISQCHQCGKPCDNHTNCENDGCHLLFIQCDDCKAAMENCCSTECLDIIHMPLVDQVRLRTGQQVGNKVFRKGKSENLKFKHSGDLPESALATAQKPADIRQKVKVKKVASGWKDLSVDATGVVDKSLQTQLTELSTAKVAIGVNSATDTTPGILVLTDTDKAMILPKTTYNTIVNPEPGMMIYDTTAKQLAVFNGSVWSFWKP